METQKYLTSLGAAKILELSVERVRQLEREGRLKAIRTAGGRFRLFKRTDVEKLAEQRRLITQTREDEKQAKLAS